ncbi:prenylcysteine oxidase-like [Thraustotheca clavata]|uniref:Prenylcysteine oxidase-like n=1 Tax=Thraustotheca clavata TaxID=74557 RepID=A0A1W0A9E5_9STRA|nr:prenylcysteine oxidase-like [Thraustotheca clavata]
MTEAQVHLNTKVTDITTINGKYQLTAGKNTYDCDGVIIAAPLEHSAIQIPTQIPSPRTFQMTHSALIEGELNTAFFKTTDLPEMILTTENTSLTFSSIGLIYSKVDGVKFSAAYFLSQADDVTLSVFEKYDRVGGRMTDFPFRDATIEAGGTIIHVNNKYMVGFAQLLGLQLVSPGRYFDGVMRMGIYNGHEFVLMTSQWSLLSTLNMLWRYGIGNLRAMGGKVQETLEKFEKIYTLQDDNKSYKSPDEMLKAIELFETTQISLEAIMTELEIDPRLINELMAAITRVNYGQNTTMSGFGGLVGLAGSGSDLRAVVGGDAQIPQGLLEMAKAQVHLNTKVTAITSTNGKYQLRAKENTYDCDGVIIAVPLEHCAIQLPVQNTLERTFQITHTTFVEGDLNTAFFETTDLPEMILTTENTSLIFTSIGLQYRKDGVSLYKVFSRSPMTPDTLSLLFLPSYKVIQTYPWSAYPKYKVPETFTPFELLPGLLYPNAIENAASAMEMSALSGRNAAILMQNFLGLEPTSMPFAHVKEEL